MGTTRITGDDTQEPVFFILCSWSIWLSALLGACIGCIGDIRRASGSSPLISAQLKFTLVALFLGFTASIDFLQTYGVGFYPLGYLFAGLCVTVVAYTMAKYELMDVSLIPSQPKVVLSVKLLALIPAYLVILLVIRIFTGSLYYLLAGVLFALFVVVAGLYPTFRKEWNGRLAKRCFENGMTHMTHWSNSLSPLCLSLS